MTRRHTDRPDDPLPSRRGGDLDLDNFEQRMLEKLEERLQTQKVKPTPTMTLLLGLLTAMQINGTFGFIGPARESQSAAQHQADSQVRRDDQQDREREKIKDKMDSMEGVVMNLNWVVMKMDETLAEIRQYVREKKP